MHGLVSHNISNFNLIAKLIIQGQGGVEDFELMSERAPMSRCLQLYQS